MRKSGDTRESTVLKALLSRLEPKKRKALEDLLPESERHIQQSLPASFPSFQLEESMHSAILEKVHWSWFMPTLKSYSKKEQKLFLSSLPPHAAKNLARALTLSLNGMDLTELARSYLRGLLLSGLVGPQDRILPIECLPETPIYALLKSTKQKLTKCIDHLSIYDLAGEVRQIVETKILKKIYSLLSEEERKLLKKAMGQKDLFVMGKLGLDRWDGSEESLRRLLHRRGLMRLGAGLSGQEPDFIWYVCHFLDIGRGTALQKACAQEAIQGVTDVVQKQIEELL